MQGRSSFLTFPNAGLRIRSEHLTSAFHASSRVSESQVDVNNLGGKGPGPSDHAPVSWQRKGGSEVAKC